MATSKYTIVLQWENDVSFQMTCKKNDEQPVIVLKMDENNHFPYVIEDIKSICKKFFDAKLKIICDEMVS